MALRKYSVARMSSKPNSKQFEWTTEYKQKKKMWSFICEFHWNGFKFLLIVVVVVVDWSLAEFSHKLPLNRVNCIVWITVQPSKTELCTGPQIWTIWTKVLCYQHIIIRLLTDSWKRFRIFRSWKLNKTRKKKIHFRYSIIIIIYQQYDLCVLNDK